MHFLLTYTLVDDYIEKRPQFRAEHLSLAKSAAERGELLLGGALADRFGRKTALQGGLVLLGGAALTVSLLGTETWHLIAGRAAMGVGAAFIMPGTLSILANVFHDPTERRKAIAIWAGFAGLGGALGTVLSGYLLEHFTWTATFLVNVPIAGLALVAGFWLVPNSSDPKEARLDPVGALLAVAGLAAFLFAIIEAPHNGWLSGRTLGVGAAAAVVLCLFVWWELRCDHPMLDVRLFRNRSFAIGSSTITLQFMAMFGLYFSGADAIQTFEDVMASDAERFGKFFHLMLDQGVYFAPSAFEAGFTSSAHGEAELKLTLDAAERAFAAL